MFEFICKGLHHLRSAARASRPFSSSLKLTENPQNQHSFVVTYLVNSCGFPPEKALSASKYVKFEAPDKPDSVLAFFKNHGFTQNQISRIIWKKPRILMCNPSKSLLPKLEFLKSKGVSSTDVTRIVSTTPSILSRSLEKIIIPSFNFFGNLLKSEEKTLDAIKNYGGLLLFGHQTHLTPNIEILQEAGVPDTRIMFFLTNHPMVFMMSSDRFRKMVEDVEKMGFNPSYFNFVGAIQALRSMTKSTWGKKVEVYKKWGLTDDEILAAFKKQPSCMMASKDKINRVMDFLVDKIGLESSFIAERPNLILLSLEKRIVPRFAVYQVLLSRGLTKFNSITLTTSILSPEKLFLNKIMNRHKEEAPELLKLYKEKLDLAK